MASNINEVIDIIQRPQVWLLSSIIVLSKEVFNRLVTRMVEQQHMLQELETILFPDLCLAVDKAKNSSKRKQLENWFKRLMDAYYKTEEAIDLLVYYQLRRMVEIKYFYPKIVVRLKTGVGLLEHQKFTSMKMQITDFLKIAKECINYRDLFLDSDSSHHERETVSDLLKESVFGRDEAREKIVRKLTKGELREHGPSMVYSSVIAITGQPGVGKTTLAKYVYNYAKQQVLFDIFMWVYVPRKFEAGDVICKMIKVKESKIPDPENEQKVQFTFNDNFPLEGLLLDINKMLHSMNCLLVLDNFGCTKVDWGQWKNFTSCLRGWGSKSKILLTTPSTEAARQIRVPEENIHKLDQLEEGAFLKLLMHHANKPEDSLEAAVGSKIAKKLKGDPKAAEVVGAQLQKQKEIVEWEKLSENDWLGDEEIMKTRIWSYQNLLHATLQRCFAFCGLFPKGHRFRGSALIILWMAEGFIRAETNGERMEDIGKSYLNELVSYSFLDLCVDEQGKEYYVLHDLLHDLAERLCSDDCIRIEYNDDGEIPMDTRNKLSEKENIYHISLQASMISKVKGVICQQKDLRTLVIFEGDETVSKKDLKGILKKCKRLRVLSLHFCGIKDLPNSIGNLKHLRYLDISGCSLEWLPSSICKLYHLQVLAVSSCKDIPLNFSQLINLRHFITSGETFSKICYVGRLTSIQSISEFHVESKSSHKLRQLGKFGELRGQLWIKGLENVSRNDVVRAKMRKKGKLKTLTLEWGGKERDTKKETEILESLCPHPLLRELHIINYHGETLPNWLLNPDLGKCLNKLSLKGCENLSYIHQFFPNCKSFHLSKLDKLKQLPPLPPKLNTLSIELPLLLSFVTMDDLQRAEEIKGSSSQVVGQRANSFKLPETILSIGLLSDLQSYLLSITRRLKSETEISSSNSKYKDFLSKIDKISHPKNYSKNELINMWAEGMDCQLEMMFSRKHELELVLPSSLTILEIIGGSITNQALSMSMQNLHYLSKLRLYGILTITALPGKDVLRELKHLQSIKILDCYLLTSMGGILALTSLKKLKLRGLCLQLQASESDRHLLPENLKALKFQNCENIDFLIEHSTLPELHTIRFCYCSIKKINLTNLSKLKRLSILGCSQPFDLKGLSSSELSLLQVWKCPEIHPVDTYKSQLPLVDIDDMSLLRLIQSDKIFELVDLEISFIKGVPIAGKVFENLTSLKFLTFHSCQITSLPPAIEGLATLCTLRLRNCQKLHDLTVLPNNLKMLEIEGCPIVEKKYGRDGPKHKLIAHIPRIVFKCLPKHTSSLWPTQPDGEEDSLVQRRLLLDEKLVQSLDDKSRFLYQYLMDVSPDFKSFKVSNDNFDFTVMETFVVDSKDIIEMIKREMLNISILKIWGMYCKEMCMTFGCAKKFVFLDPEKCAGRLVSSDLAGTSEYLRNFFLKVEDESSFIILPYHQGLHWMLIIVQLSTSTAYVVDSRNPESCDHLKIKLAFNKAIRSLDNTFEWNMIKGPEQPGSTECGYYVMRSMLNIISHYVTNQKLPSVVEPVAHQYPKSDIDYVVRELAAFITPRLNSCMFPFFFHVAC